MAVLAVVSLFNCFAHAECNPRDFLAKDVEKLKFSKALYSSAIDMADEGSTEIKNKKFDAGAVVEGAPVQLSASDAKQLTQYSNKLSSRTVSQDEQLSYLKIALSATGADAYKECLKNLRDSIKLDLQSSAFTSQIFAGKLTWSPTKNIKKNPAAAEITVVNGTAKVTVDGKSTKAAEIGFLIEANTSTAVVFERNVSLATSITVSIDGDVEILYLPAVEKPNLKLALLSKEVDIGSWNGNGDAKRQKVCIFPSSPQSVLLPSTTVLVDAHKMKEGPAGKYTRISAPDVQPGSICVTVESDAIGASTHEWHVSLALRVYEAQPIN